MSIQNKRTESHACNTVREIDKPFQLRVTQPEDGVDVGRGQWDLQPCASMPGKMTLNPAGVSLLSSVTKDALCPMKRSPACQGIRGMT
jgi:hypothetical protein